jgi:predicted transcriptional regulator YdeE
MERLEVATDSFLVAGIKTRTTNRIEAVSEMARIPPLWRRYFADKIGEAVPHRAKADGIIVVYTNFADESRGAYTVIIGHKVPSLDQTVEGLDVVAVDAGRYVRFALEKRTCQCMVETWDEIRRIFRYSHENERAFTAEFEVHRADQSEFYVSVK